MTRRDRGTSFARRLWPLPVAVLALAGCGGPQNALDPHSHPAHDIANLFWWMTGGAFVGLGLVVGLLVLSWLRRDTRGLPPDPDDPHPGEKAGWTVVVGLGVGLALATVIAVFVVSAQMLKVTQAPAASSTALTIQVVGHQWWWEIRYPGTTAVTANELHIPVGTRVNLVVGTADVIHSFWVPELNRKIDTIPGKKNRILLYADAPGVYRGECAEYCGLQHAHMSLKVFAQPPAQFRAWLANEAKPARAPTTALQRKGEQVVLNGPCSSCHTLRGTSASGYLGPDLTHLAGRTTLGAVTIPNRKGYLGGWILDSQHVKPGNEMPDVDLTGPQLQAVLAYLESLK
ncbi:MAG TPA: cytochrome c oxidase subunit II [Gaiellaceae bacterium]|nr:cytochrome c oxidase subunit II [Gaiellaceae bacterium]